MVLSIVDNINNWLDAVNLNTALGTIILVTSIMAVSFILLAKIGLPGLINLTILIMEAFLFMLLGWIPMWIAFVVGLISFLLLYIKIRGGGGVTVDD